MHNADAPAAVLDTNVVLDWLVFRDAAVAPLAAAIVSGALRWLAAERMREELAWVIGRDSLVRWVPDREQALAVFDRYAIRCESAPPSHLPCRDPDDQHFIDLAVAARADWLLTHDRALLALASRARAHGVRVVVPAAWHPLPT